MRTRALHTTIDELGRKKTEVVWFGSTGVISDGFDVARWDMSLWDSESGVAKFYDKDKNSFSSGQKSVSDSLTQKLSIIKNELWYDMNYGLPLFEKSRSKMMFDGWILKVINMHPDVVSVISFTSSIDKSNYHCSVKVQSTYGEIDINL